MGRGLILTNQGIKVNSHFTATLNPVTSPQTLFTVPADQYAVITFHTKVATVIGEVTTITLLVSGLPVYRARATYDTFNNVLRRWDSQNSANGTAAYDSAADDSTCITQIVAGPGQAVSVTFDTTNFGFATVTLNYHAVTFINQ